jgi:predicted metal-binding membrane protein
MRYLSLVTDFIHQHALAHLSAAEARLSAVIARPKRIALACVAALSGLGWITLALMVAGTGWAALCRPEAIGGGWTEFALVLPMWVAMTLAMMLPTAGPMILTYAEIADTAARKRERIVSPVVLTAGYALVWLGFALVAATLQIVLARSGLLIAGTVDVLLAGTIFLGAGLYQFSALKQACLTLCQRPFPFFLANWTDERNGVLQLGLRQGLFCLGCCWALMLVMFAVGVMNVFWMAALGALMMAEKMAGSARFSAAIGIACVALGLAMVLASVG